MENVFIAPRLFYLSFLVTVRKRAEVSGVQFGSDSCVLLIHGLPKGMFCFRLLGLLCRITELLLRSRNRNTSRGTSRRHSLFSIHNELQGPAMISGERLRVAVEAFCTRLARRVDIGRCCAVIVLKTPIRPRPLLEQTAPTVVHWTRGAHCTMNILLDMGCN